MNSDSEGGRRHGIELICWVAWVNLYAALISSGMMLGFLDARFFFATTSFFSMRRAASSARLSSAALRAEVLAAFLVGTELEAAALRVPVVSSLCTAEGYNQTYLLPLARPVGPGFCCVPT